MLNWVYRRRVFKRLNEVRVRQGADPLDWGGCAQSFADKWAQFLVSNDEFYHQDLGGLLNTCHATKAGEVLAKGTGLPIGIVRAWMDSPKHREVILRPDYNRVGISVRKNTKGEMIVVANLLYL